MLLNVLGRTANAFRDICLCVSIQTQQFGFLNVTLPKSKVEQQGRSLEICEENLCGTAAFLSCNTFPGSSLLMGDKDRQ